MPLPLRWRWKLDRLREKVSWFFGGKKAEGRPRLCPSCGTLVGATASRCHQCGASMTFSLAAASKTLSRLMPTTSPVTYAILTLSCILVRRDAHADRALAWLSSAYRQVASGHCFN